MKKLFYIIIFIFFASNSFGATHYFSQSGNDSTGSGTFAAPWKTISKMHTEMDNGDIILLKEGDTWTVTARLTISDDNITVAAYNASTGDRVTTWSTSKPCLDGADNYPALNGSLAIVNNGVDNVVIENIEFKRARSDLGGTPTGGHGLIISQTEAGTVTNPTVRYCYFHLNFLGAIKVQATTTGGTYEYNEARDCAMKKYYDTGASSWPGVFNLREGTGETTKYNYIHDTWGEAIKPGEGGTVEYNIVGPTHSVGIYSDGQSDVVIRYNVVYGSEATDLQTDYMYSSDAGGYHGMGITVGSESGQGAIDNIKVYGNTVINRYTCLRTYFNSQDASNIYFYNNICIDNRYQLQLNSTGDIQGSTLYIKNNLFAIYDNVDSGNGFASGGGTNYAECDNNIWYDEGVITISGDSCTNSITTDPKLTRESWRQTLSGDGDNALGQFNAGDLSPINSTGSQVDAGLNLGSIYDDIVIVPGTVFDATTKPTDISFATVDQDDYTPWDIGSFLFIEQSSYTVCSSGCNYTQAQFEALSGDWSGTTFYFSGTFTTDHIFPGIYGTSGNPVVLDGYQAGNCNPVGNQSSCAGAATITLSTASGVSNAGFRIEKDYITVQDFNITACSNGFLIRDDGTNTTDYTTIKRNYVNGAYYGGLYSGVNSKSTPFVTNLTVGGAAGDGNYFAGGSEGGNTEFFNILGTNDVIISYNLIKPDDPGISYPSTNLLAVHYSDDVLIEYNNIYNEYFDGQLISIKENATTTDAVIRFNKLTAANANDEMSGISIGYADRVYVYGNYIRNSDDHGVRIKEVTDNIYIFSNIIAEHDLRGFWTEWQSQETGVGSFWFYNNTVYNNADDAPSSTCVALYIGDLISGKVGTIKNNIFQENNAYVSSPYEFQWLVGSTTLWGRITESHNIFYHSGESASSDMVRVVGGSDYQASELTSSSFADPGLVDPSNGDFRISSSNSAVFNSGVDMGSGNIISLTIIGESVTVPWDFAFGPETSFAGVILVIDDVYRDSLQWSQGAYEYEAPTQKDIEGLNLY